LEHHFLRRVFFAAVLGAMLVAGCATVSAPPAGPSPAVPGGPGPAAPPETPGRIQAPPTTSVNPPTSVNLQGFPLPYRQGYADGCASVGILERKDAARFKSDGQYRTGWQDGFALCTKR
jgi:hypothetical protein